jgi:hypothetical protein
LYTGFNLHFGKLCIVAMTHEEQLT